MFACNTATALSVDVAVTGVITYSQALASTQLPKGVAYGVVSAITNVAPAAGTFTCATTDICTFTAHGYVTGLKVQVSTTTTLPTGLSASTDYFVIKLTANTFSLASSLVLAQAGTAIDITGAGSGTHTITPTAIAGASVKLQGSMDNTTFVDVPIKATGDATKSCAITTTVNCYLAESVLAFNYIRAYYTITAGQISVSQISKVKLP